MHIICLTFLSTHLVPNSTQIYQLASIFQILPWKMAMKFPMLIISNLEDVCRGHFISLRHILQ